MIPHISTITCISGLPCPKSGIWESMGNFKTTCTISKGLKCLITVEKNKLDTHKSTLKNFRMKSSTSIINIVSYYFILLFIYATVSKLIDFETFYTQLEQTPLLKSYSKFIAYGVLFSELMTAGLLCYRKTRRTGIIFSFILMLLFSIYIIGILKFSKNLPCSCGGILEK